MDHDQLIRTMHVTGVTNGVVISRLTDLLVRTASGNGAPQHADGMQERIHALAAVAEHHFSSASWMGWLTVAPPAEQAQTWKAAQQWSRLNPPRFAAPADLLTQRIRQYYGEDLARQLEGLGADGLDRGAQLIEQAAHGRVTSVAAARKDYSTAPV